MLAPLFNLFDYTGAGGHMIAAAISGSSPGPAFLIKVFFTALCVGVGFRGGEIVPTMFIGSTFGCVAGPLLGLDPGFSAAVGLTALFCSVVNCPIASVFLAAELFAPADISLFALAAGKALYNRFPPEEKSILQYGTLVTNSGFAGLPVVQGAYGSQGLFLGSLFIIPTRILMWSAGISLFEREGDAWERARKILLNPAIIAVELGLVRMVFQLPLPGFLDSALKHLGDCTSPLAMALVGAILADVELRSVLEPKAFYLVLVRQIILPLVCLAGLKAMRVDPLTTGVSVALSGMPVGSTTAILAQKYGADARFASKCVFISTVTSLVTVPVLTLLL